MHAAGVRQEDRLLGVLDIRSAIPDGEIELAVGAEAQAVQVVAEEADVDAEAVVQQLALVGLAVAVGVAQLPEVGNAGVPNVAVARDEAGADAVGGVVEAVGEDRGLVGPAVAGRVLDQADAVVVDAVVLEVVAELALVHGDAVVDGAAGEVVVEPVHVAADVGDAVVKAEGLGDVEAVLLIDGEADGVGEQRLGGEEIDLEALGDLDAFLRLHPLVGGGGDLRRVRLVGRRRRRAARRRTGRRRRRQEGAAAARRSFLCMGTVVLREHLALGGVQIAWVRREYGDYRVTWRIAMENR